MIYRTCDHCEASLPTDSRSRKRFCGRPCHDAYWREIREEGKRRRAEARAGLARRDEGIREVRASNAAWIEEALDVIERSRSFRTDPQAFTSNEIRRAVVDTLGEEPTHPNAWGALVRLAALRNIIEPTNQPSPRSARSDARGRRLTVWKFTETGGTP